MCSFSRAPGFGGVGSITIGFGVSGLGFRASGSFLPKKLFHPDPGLQSSLPPKNVTYSQCCSLTVYGKIFNVRGVGRGGGVGMRGRGLHVTLTLVAAVHLVTPLKRPFKIHKRCT